MAGIVPFLIVVDMGYLRFVVVKLLDGHYPGYTGDRYAFLAYTRYRVSIERGYTSTHKQNLKRNIAQYMATYTE